MNKKNIQIIKGIVEDILQKIDFKCEVSVKNSDLDENKFVCDIKAQKDANFLIGQNGDNLQALQHIVRLLVRKQTDENIKFILDVNSYKKDQESSVVEMASELAKQAVFEKKTIVMRPMSAYNRRLVHMSLANNEDVITESTGDENERRVVIKPVFLL